MPFVPSIVVVWCQPSPSGGTTWTPYLPGAMFRISGFADLEVVRIVDGSFDLGRRHRVDRAVAEARDRRARVAVERARLVFGAERVAEHVGDHRAAHVVDEDREAAETGLADIPGVIDRRDVVEREDARLCRRQRLRRDSVTSAW